MVEIGRQDRALLARGSFRSVTIIWKEPVP